MIDKITPRPDACVEEMLKKDGIEGLEPVITSKNTYVAPFVNAEECEYLVIEDTFPNGRPALDKGGLIFTERETVDKVEKMKVCTCLNPLHTTLAIFGCLLGYQKISDEMKDAELSKLVEIIGYEEGLPVVTDPEILNPWEFLDTVLNVRIPNPFMPDTPQRTESIHPVADRPIPKALQNQLVNDWMITVQGIAATAEIIIISIRCQHIINLIVKALEAEGGTILITFSRVVKYHIQDYFDPIVVKLSYELL